MKKYSVIYADPPWRFETYSEKGKEKKSAECHYDTMTMEDIYSLDIQSIADENCALFLWVTSPMLKEGLETIRRWGFTYKTVAFNWFKKNKISDSWFWGLGYWTRQNTEFCLLATRGHPQRVSKGVHQVVTGNIEIRSIMDNDSAEKYLEQFENFDIFDTEQIVTKIEKHSKKPDIVRDRIVELCGDVARIELFARQATPGWDVFGNEVEGSEKIWEQLSMNL